VFLRHRRGADLTVQGERFIDYARNAIALQGLREVAAKF